MGSAEEYRQQVSDLGLGRMQIEASSLAEGKAALARVRKLQRALGQIKRSVDLGMKIIGAAYSQEIAEPGRERQDGPEERNSWQGVLPALRATSRCS
jgi:hypothetical protein